MPEGGSWIKISQGPQKGIKGEVRMINVLLHKEWYFLYIFDLLRSEGL